MLILSRREADRVVFPTLGISIELLKLRGNTVRLGIDAPADIPILRDELLPRTFQMTPDREAVRESLLQLVQAVQSRLDAAALHMNHLHRQFEDGELAEGQQTLLDLFRELKALEKQASDALEQHSEANRKKHILVVEDSVSENKMLSNMLKLCGAEVTTAADGNDALDFLSLHAAPDALIMGSHMQRCDGAAFLGQIRSQSALDPLKIIAIGDRDAKLGSLSADQGVDTWLPGPIDPNDLLVALDMNPATTAA